MIESLFGSVTTVSPAGRTTKLLSAANRVFALRDDGVLFGRGADSATTGVLGNNGTSVIGSWFTVLTNVKDFWVSTNFTLMVTNDNRWFYNGRYVNGLANPIALVPTEITSSFSALSSPVKKVAVGMYGLALLDVAGNLYTMGYNTTGWAFTGDLTDQPTLTLRTETGVKDIVFCDLRGTLYLHYNDLSVKGAGNNTSGQLGTGAATQRTLVVVSTVAQGATQITAGADIIWFRRSGGWYYMGANTLGQTGQNTASGNATAQTLMPNSGPLSTLICQGYRTWGYNSNTGVWYYTGNLPAGSGTVTISTVPWNGGSVLVLTAVPVSGYPFVGNPITSVDAGAQSYALGNNILYGCGNATANKLLPGLGTSSGNVGFRKLNNDFTYVE